MISKKYLMSKTFKKLVIFPRHDERDASMQDNCSEAGSKCFVLPELGALCSNPDVYISNQIGHLLPISNLS
mgnify:CR=1 FL=1